MPHFIHANNQALLTHWHALSFLVEFLHPSTPPTNFILVVYSLLLLAQPIFHPASVIHPKSLLKIAWMFPRADYVVSRLSRFLSLAQSSSLAYALTNQPNFFLFSQVDHFKLLCSLFFFPNTQSFLDWAVIVLYFSKRFSLYCLLCIHSFLFLRHPVAEHLCPVFLLFLLLIGPAYY